MREPQPTFDGDRLTSQQLAEAFRRPPGAPIFPPSRGTLLVGARGSGKTTLLKHTEADLKGAGVYCDLRTLFNELSADTGAAGLSFDSIPSVSEGPIQDKALAILATAVSRKITSKFKLDDDQNLRISLSHLAKEFPNGDATPLQWIHRNISTIDPSKFRQKPNIDDLMNYLDSSNNLIREKTGRSLLLLIDRAEEIPYPALTPILQLLDQSHSFQAVVATRPGMMGLSNNLHFSLPRPGDHYDIYHLGASPYSSEWTKFQRQVLQAWMPRTLSNVPEDELDELLRLSRDSLRVALEITYQSLDETGKYDRTTSNNAVLNLQRMLLDAANGAARSVGVNLLQMTNSIRKDYSNSRLPVAIRLLQETMTKESDQLALIPEILGGQTLDARSEKFVRLALRTWFFSTMHGTSWSPIMVPEIVEINPMFLWHPSSRWHSWSKRKTRA